MGRYVVNLSDGREVTLDADQEPTETDVLSAIKDQGVGDQSQSQPQDEQRLRESLGGGIPIPHDSMELAAQNYQVEKDAPQRLFMERFRGKVNTPEDLARVEKIWQRENEKPLPTPGVIGAAGYAAASPFNYAGRILRAIPADLATDTTGEADGNLYEAITSPTDLQKPLPIDERLKLAAEDEADRGQFGLKTLLANTGQAIPAVVPKIAAVALAPESLPWQMGVAGGVFGLQDDGSFSVKDAALGALMPGVGQAARKTAGEVIAKSLSSGSQILSNPIAQKTVESLSEQAALNAMTLAAQTPELMELAKKDPQAFWKQIAGTVSQNIAFGMLGSKNMVDEKIPSETQKFFEAQADEQMAKIADNPPEAIKRVMSPIQIAMARGVDPNAITPDMMPLVNRAFNEATGQKRIMLPGEIPAVDLLNKQGRQNIIEIPGGSKVASRPEGVEGGRISFSAPAEGDSIPSARQSAVTEKSNEPVKTEEKPVEEPQKISVNDLVPALHADGETFVGQPGETHAKIRERITNDPNSTPEQKAAVNMAFLDDSGHVFADNTGKIYDRDSASKAIGEDKPLQSERLNELKSKSDSGQDKIINESLADKDFANIQSPHKPGVIDGLKLTPEAVPKLQEIQKQSNAAMTDAIKAGDNNAFKAAFGKSTYIGGMIEGALRKGPNYDAYTAQQKAAETKPVEPVQPAGEAASDMDVEGVTPLSPESGSPLSATESLINRTQAKQLRKGLITGTAAEKWADEVLRGGGTHAGPDVLAAYAVKGAALLEKGTLSVSEWGKRMVQEFGDSVEPHLQKIWDNIHATVGNQENGSALSSVDLWKGVGPKIAAQPETAPPAPAPAAASKPSIIQRVGNFFRNAHDFVTINPVPKLTRAGVQDAAVQHAYARIAAPRIVDDMLSQVFPDSFKDPEAMSRVMDVLNKDNILGGYDEFLSRAQQAAKDGDTRAYNKWMDMAKSVGDAQDLAKISAEVEAAKNDPIISGAINRWKEIVNPELDTLYNEMKGVDPNTDREGRGRVFGARVNLLPKSEEANWQNLEDVSKPAPSSSSGNYRNPNAKRDKFDRAAKYTGNYSTDAQAVLANVIYPRWNEVTKLRFFDSLVKSGKAVWVENGDMPETIGGEKAQRLPVKVPETKVSTPKEGDPVERTTRQVEKVLAVPESMVGEIRRVLDTDYMMKQNPIAKGLTQVQLLQLADASAHLKNIHSVIAGAQGTRSLFTDVAKKIPGLATGDAVIRIGKTVAEIASDSPEIRSEMAFMAKNGMLRQDYPSTGVQKITKMQDLIHTVDTASRVVMNRFFDNLVQRGLVKDSMEQRRAFVQQIGEYNRRLMGPSMQWLSRSGLSPFIVAGRNFNRFAKRSLIGSPGVEGATKAASAQMRVVNLVGLATLVTLPAMINAVTTGSIWGRRGTPVGAVDMGGKEDDKGNHKVLDLLQLMGIRRGLRATGIQSVAEGISNGRAPGEIVDNAISDMTSTAAHPWMGPALGAAYSILTGKRLDLRGGANPYIAKKVAPGESQIAENARVTLENQNSLIYGALRPLFNDTDKSYGQDLLAGAFKAPLSALGITDAKAPELKEAQKLAASGEQTTADQADRAKNKRELVTQVKEGGDEAIKKLEAMVASGDLTKSAKTDIEKRAKLSQLQYAVEKYLTPQDSIRVYRMASPENQGNLRKIIALKTINNENSSTDQKAAIYSIIQPAEDDAMQYPPIKFSISSGGQPYHFLISSKAKVDYEAARDANFDKVQSALVSAPGWANLTQTEKDKVITAVRERVDNTTKSRFFSDNYKKMVPLQ